MVHARERVEQRRVAALREVDGALRTRAREREIAARQALVRIDDRPGQDRERADVIARDAREQLASVRVRVVGAAQAREEDLEARDARDSSRSVAPLKPAADALLLDNSDQTIDESVAQVLQWWQGKQPFRSA